MKDQTRPLLQLLADDTTARLLAVLRREPRTTPQLQKETGASQKTVIHLLELLEAHGIVDGQQSDPGARGRPSRRWRLTADDQLTAFEHACDELKAGLLRTQLGDYDDGDGSRPQKSTTGRRGAHTHARRPS